MGHNPFPKALDRFRMGIIQKTMGYLNRHSADLMQMNPDVAQKTCERAGGSSRTRLV
jgi:hypothetical protein